MTYQYRKTGHFLVREEQSFADVLRIFWLGYARHRLDSLGMSRLAARKVIKVFLVNKLRRGDSSRHVALPVSAHLGMQVHGGYKLFDFDRSQVTKVFGSDMSSQEAAKEILSSISASEVSAAPRHLGADAESKWFTEEYIRGTHATDVVSAGSSDYLQHYPEIEKCLLELASCRPPEMVSIHAHVDRLAKDSYFARWEKAEASADDLAHISTYLRNLRAWLISNAEIDQIPLVLTHGDFSLVNAIVTNDGLRIIDWEGIGPGCIYSDIYNFVLAELYYERTSPDFIAEANSVIERYRRSVIHDFPSLSGAASINDRFARRLFYLERTRQMIDREVTPNTCKVINKSIAMFRQFDSDLGDEQV